MQSDSGLTEAPSISELREPRLWGKYGPMSLQSSWSIRGDTTTASSYMFTALSDCYIISF